ncbi:hypothetical protein REPUB_Repub12eG0057700 [Reevesia pubescens]
MIAGYLHHDRVDEAYQLFVKMPKRDRFSYTLMITCFTRKGELEKARELFDLFPHKRDVACWNVMIGGYGMKRRVVEAKRLFDEMPVRNVVSWNMMLSCYTQNGEMRLGKEFFERMAKRDSVSWNLMVDGFIEVGDLASAWEFFEKIPYPNVVSWVTMLSGLARRGKILEARRLFDQIPCKNVVSWNAMIGAYVKDYQIEEAARLFRKMPKRDSISWTTMIDGYVHVGQLDKAREILNQMPYKNIAAQTAMLSGYIKNKRMDEACQIFNEITARDIVCWNTMIAGYAQMGRMDKALNLFKEMENKDLVTWNTMIIGYAQTGEMEKAVKIFEEMKIRNVVSWNSLITGFLQNGLSLDALNSFKLMANEGTIPDHSTFACGLSACANLAALQVGKQMHNMVLKSGYVNDLFVGNALITMYAKCGRILYAQLIFKDLDKVDVISWNSLITGYALNGHGKEAVQLFEQMVLKGVLPDHVTFIGVLSGCSHIGLVDQGLKLFKRMTEVYSVEPLVEHYACIVDMLGRSGMLYEAFEVVRGLKIRANAGIWGALLAACKTHGNLKLGKIAAKKLLEFEPHKTSNFVLLSNMQAEAGSWAEVENMRLMMKETEAEKQPGCSWIEVRNQLHCFLSNMPMQPETAEVYSKLNALTSQIRNLDCTVITNGPIHSYFKSMAIPLWTFTRTGLTTHLHLEQGLLQSSLPGRMCQIPDAGARVAFAIECSAAA